MPIATFPGMEMVQASAVDLFTDGQVQYECIHALAGRYPSIAAMTAMDLSVEAETFGAPIKLSDSEPPTVTGSLVTDMAGVEALTVLTVSDRLGHPEQMTPLERQTGVDRMVRLVLDALTDDAR